MAARETVTEITTPLAWPDQVTLSVEEMSNPRFTPRELDLIQEQLGRSFSAVMQDEDSDDRVKVIAWLKLRRDGHKMSLDDLADVVIGFAVGDSENPTNATPPTGSPTSATGGE